MLRHTRCGALRPNHIGNHTELQRPTKCSALASRPDLPRRCELASRLLYPRCHCCWRSRLLLRPPALPRRTATRGVHPRQLLPAGAAAAGLLASQQLLEGQQRAEGRSTAWVEQGWACILDQPSCEGQAGSQHRVLCAMRLFCAPPILFLQVGDLAPWRCTSVLLGDLAPRPGLCARPGLYICQLISDCSL